MNIADLNSALMDLVAPEGWRQMGITDATIDLAASAAPRLTMNCHVQHAGGSSDAQRVRRMYVLQPVQQAAPALDIEAMVQAATQRLGRHIHKAAETAAWEVKHAFQLARGRAVERHKDAQRKHGDVMARHYLERLGAYVDRIDADRIEKRGPYAAGGAVKAGQFYLVGER